jgi:hypothetical protein
MGSERNVVSGVLRLGHQINTDIWNVDILPSKLNATKKSFL